MRQARSAGAPSSHHHHFHGKWFHNPMNSPTADSAPHDCFLPPFASSRSNCNQPGMLRGVVLCPRLTPTPTRLLLALVLFCLVRGCLFPSIHAIYSSVCRSIFLERIGINRMLCAKLGVRDRQARRAVLQHLCLSSGASVRLSLFYSHQYHFHGKRAWRALITQHKGPSTTAAARGGADAVLLSTSIESPAI